MDVNSQKFFQKKQCSISINNWSDLSFQLRNKLLEFENHFADEDQEVKEQIKKDEWIEKQNEFKTKCLDICKETLNKWGYYHYDIEDTKLFGTYVDRFGVWQLFPHDFCLAEDIDYEEEIWRHNLGKRIFEEFLYYKYEEWITNDLIRFFYKIDKPYSVVLCNRDEFIYKSLENPQTTDFMDELQYALFTSKISYCWLDDLWKHIDIMEENIFIIDVVTNNDRLRTICKNILEQNKHSRPNITVISIYKELDRDEMLDIIKIRKEAKAVIMDKKFKQGYEYYVSVKDFKPFSACSSADWRKIIASKTLFEEKTLELEMNKSIEVMLEEAISLAEASHIELAKETIVKAEQKRDQLVQSNKEDKELKALIEKTKNHLNLEYKEAGFSEEWKELRVDYCAPKEFLQMDNWAYAVSKFPEKGTILYPFRRRKTARTGHIEKFFLEQLREWLPAQVRPIHDICINVSDDSRPYEPDIALFLEGHDTIRIDVEIDEPYAAFSKEPIHYITCGDEYRDDLLNRHGWIVVRFAEKQIKKYPKSCVLYLVKLIKSLVPEMAIPTDLLSVNPLPPMKRWTKNEAIIMAANGEREKYLDHVFSKTEEIKIELADIRLNENERKCQSLVKASAMSIDMTEKMTNFTDSGAYERDKYIDFAPFEHIYIYKGTEQLLPVSSLIAYFFEKFNALEQAERKSERYHKPVEYYLKLWDKIGKLASEVGTFVHLQTENYFKNGKFETEYQFEYEGIVETINVKKEKEHFLNFIKDFSIIPYRQEWPIYDVDLNIAGTIDLICKEDDGEYSIYDWKRSSKIIDAFGHINVRGFNDKMSFNGINVPDTAYYHYCIQQNLYRYMLEKNYGIKIKSMNLVVLCPEYSKYYKVNVPVMDEVIGSIINVCKEKNLGCRLLN